MKTSLAEFLLSCFLGLGLLLGVWIIFVSQHYYLVKVTFCDSRKPVIIRVVQIFPPDNKDIENYHLASPEYEGYLNVCDVKTLK